jgi:hypothetical protein
MLDEHHSVWKEHLHRHVVIVSMMIIRLMQNLECVHKMDQSDVKVENWFGKIKMIGHDILSLDNVMENDEVQ